MNVYLQRAENIVSRIHELAAVSETSPGITRRYGTAAALEAGSKVMGWMRAAGLQTRVDAIGNIRGLLSSPVAGAGTLVIASHIDTVVNAGRWDGPLGVLMGLDLLENVVCSGRKLPFHVELIAFCDEEGVRFHTTYLGSKVVAGSFEKEVLDRKDEEGVSLGEAMHKIGGDPADLERDAIPPDQWLGYFEIHIEQGPVLYESKIPVGPVKAIAGQVRAEVIFKGMAGHAGTVPMDMRNDALCGAAEFVLALEGLARASEGGLVATVGKLQITNAASNVIPGEVVCSVDIRSADEEVLSRGLTRCRGLVAEIGARRGLTVLLNVVQTSPPVICDARMNELLGRAIGAAGYEVLELVSGAGHDAVPISAVAPVCMMFVRCHKGISHHPLEHVEMEDLRAAIAVADDLLHQLSEIWKYPL
ncbi:MAG: M20 family metallo-hydrolase [Chitinophagaceae bacterium]|nr:M20 family metallo-hydrolase [Chitinophagaceae bacterium]